jgi:hypothetical protein
VRFSGCLAVSNWSRGAVAALLPEELELARCVGTPAVDHPDVLIFSEQTEGGPIFAGINIPLGTRYHELGVAIPFVRYEGGTSLHTFMLRMYSSFFPTVVNGNVFYGYAKELATLTRDGPLFRLTDPAGVLLLHAVVEPAAAWESADTCVLPNFDAFREMFTLPIIGLRSGGTYVTSYFDWDFSDAEVRPARAAIVIDQPLARHCDPQRSVTLADGTFEVDGLRWRVTWPLRRRSF